MHVIVLTDSKELYEHLNQGLLALRHDVRRLFTSVEQYEEFLLLEQRFIEEQMLFIIDTHFGIPNPLEPGGKLQLPDDSPALTLIPRTKSERPAWVQLAIAHGGSDDDGHQSMVAGAHFYHSCKDPGWYLSSSFENAIGSAVEGHNRLSRVSV